MVKIITDSEYDNHPKGEFLFSVSMDGQKICCEATIYTNGYGWLTYYIGDAYTEDNFYNWSRKEISFFIKHEQLSEEELFVFMMNIIKERGLDKQ